MSGATWDDCGRSVSFGYRAFTFCGRPSHAVRLNTNFVTPWALLRLAQQVPQHRCSNGRNLDTALVWADPRSLAATEGVDFSFLSCRYLDVSVPCVPAVCTAPGDKSRSVSRSRTPPDHSLLSGSPKFIAAMPRPSSALDTKASTIHS